MSSEDRLAALYQDVQAVLDETLSLGGRAYKLKPDAQLLGVLPELDSHAVVNVIMGLEERFGITFDDSEIDAEVFATLKTLAILVAAKTS